MKVRLYHPKLKRTIERTERHARVLMRSGWVPADEFFAYSATGSDAEIQASVEGTDQETETQDDESEDSEEES